ncbi:endonuclease/exonuclease/phosphatase family protein [Hoeflea sp. EC-HK425]|uniref:endonuclease/exonuclease/phosphatase family protein n=1 Tax=Hoeflea sp. EC-HK425 TaxID=2038388 RepID=UPI00125B015E|nr:endonuclease/exonuclease/phosphatase family protein [Hoeflea sp. EC-HK425]VVT28204.1 conserved exported hypothetical protein [Hoeflea sp. EC-HK425]|tara:strand:- start:6311 stop:7405 length:1095 start_codon:yes stop_codon:yes gene_type:complete
MNWKSTRFTLALFSCLAAPTANAEELKIGSWNIANLAEGPGIALRGHVRTENDYRILRDTIKALDVDILALQELGSEAAAEAILPDGYKVVFEDRCTSNAENCKKDVDDIFTAIAYRGDKFPDIKIEQIDDLDIEHQSECTTEEARKVRGAPVAKFTWDGQKYAVPSLHLKASCGRNSASNTPDLADDCVTQAKQIDRLIEWIGEPEQAGYRFILTGDWNRELGTSSDTIRKRLEAVDANVRFEPQERVCWKDYTYDYQQIRTDAEAAFPEIRASGNQPWAYTPDSGNDIDFFVVLGVPSDIQISAEQLQMSEGRRLDKPSNYLKTCPPDSAPKPFAGQNKVLVFSPANPSDHCPIRMTLGSSQ